MLKLTGLNMYVDKFHAEQVSGDMLMELDEVSLEEELGVVSKLHRLKILRVISGRGAEDIYRLVD